jgi:hypothetical protein
MNRYQRAKIYQLVNDVDDKVYVGSTCAPLSKRLYWHKITAKSSPDRHVYKHLVGVGWANVRIVIIEEVNCDNKQQLLRREQHHIDTMKPELNRYGAIAECPHNRQKSTCKDCNGVGICEHNRIKNYCKECGGASICVHNREKSYCKACGGSQICLHNRRKAECNACGGSQMCVHNKRKARCKDCSPYYCECCDITLSVECKNKHNKSVKHIANFIAY